MKYKARAAAAVLRSRARSRRQDDEHSAGSRQAPAAGQEPVVQIIDPGNDQGFSEVWPDQPGQQSYPDDKLKDAVRLSLLGIAIALYLLAMIFILF